MAPRDPTNPDLAELRRLARRAMARGCPPQVAEDLVVAAWEKAAAAFDAERGAFGALLTRTLDREVLDWWRHRGVQDRLEPALTVHERSRHARAVDPETRALAHRNQQRLLEALDADERAVFHTWALQRHLPRGAFPASAAAERLGLEVPAYEAAKKRLRRRISALLDAWGLSPRDLIPLPDDVGDRRMVNRG